MNLAYLKKKFIFVLSLVLLPSSGVAFSATLNVPAEYSTIQQAINHAGYGDTVLVSSGIYYENLQMKSGVKLIGSGFNSTVIDGRGINSVIYAYEDIDIEIEGFTIKNSAKDGYMPGSAGIHLDPRRSGKGLMVIRKCKIENNGVGIQVWNNFAPTVIIENNIIISNQYNGIGGTLGTHIIKNNTVMFNGRDGYGDWAGGGTHILENNIFAKNGRYGVFKHRNTPMDLSYNDVYGNGRGSYYEGYYGDTPFTPLPGTGEISADPLIVNTDCFNLHTTSPAIDNGTSVSVPLSDIENDVRPLGSGVDMGANEYNPAGNSCKYYSGPYVMNIPYINAANYDFDSNAIEVASGLATKVLNNTGVAGTPGIWLNIGSLWWDSTCPTTNGGCTLISLNDLTDTDYSPGSFVETDIGVSGQLIYPLLTDINFLIVDTDLTGASQVRLTSMGNEAPWLRGNYTNSGWGQHCDGGLTWCFRYSLLEPLNDYYPIGTAVKGDFWWIEDTTLVEAANPGDMEIYVAANYYETIVPYVVQLGTGSSHNSATGIHTITTNMGAQLKPPTGMVLDSVAVTETLAGQSAFYALSFDNRAIFKIWDTQAAAWRDVVYFDNNIASWFINADVSGSTNWIQCTHNDMNLCLSEAFKNPANQMNGMQFAAITASEFASPNGWSVGTMDLAVGMETTDPLITPSVDNVAFTFINPDTDGDGIPDDSDNCPFNPNADQADFDGDGIGNVCDPDDDNDGVLDTFDACPLIDASGFDADKNGCIDALSDLPSVLDTLVLEGVISPEIQNSMTSKIDNAEKSASKDNICAAINQLEAFKNQVSAQQGNKVSNDAAELLLNFADNIIQQLLNQLPEGGGC